MHKVLSPQRKLVNIVRRHVSISNIKVNEKSAAAKPRRQRDTLVVVEMSRIVWHTLYCTNVTVSHIPFTGGTPGGPAFIAGCGEAPEYSGSPPEQWEVVATFKYQLLSVCSVSYSSSLTILVYYASFKDHKLKMPMSGFSCWVNFSIIWLRKYVVIGQTFTNLIVIPSSDTNKDHYPQSSGKRGAPGCVSEKPGDHQVCKCFGGKVWQAFCVSVVRNKQTH